MPLISPTMMAEGASWIEVAPLPPMSTKVCSEPPVQALAPSVMPLPWSGTSPGAAISKPYWISAPPEVVLGPVYTKVIVTRPSRALPGVPR